MFRRLFTGAESERLDRLERIVQRLIIRVDKLSTDLSTSAPVTIAARLDDLQGALMQLRDSNRREFGKLWKRSEPELMAPTAPNGDAYDVCENWEVAQREGPTSRAASCECAYCDAKREPKKRLRNLEVPRTIRGQAKLAKDNGS